MSAEEAVARQRVGRASRQPLQRARPDVGERAVVAAAVMGAEHREQRRVLARVVAVWGGGVDAVVGGEDEQVAGVEAVGGVREKRVAGAGGFVEPLAAGVVDPLERLREAANVVAMAVDLIGL